MVGVLRSDPINVETGDVTSGDEASLLVSVEKSYLGLSLGWERELSEAYSIGILATEFVWKGDNSGVEVQYIGDSNTDERDRMYDSILKFVRKDLIESPQFYIRYRF